MKDGFENGHVLLVGPGAIGIDYFKVLKALGVGKITVVGRQDQSAEVFYSKTGQKPEIGLKKFLASNEAENITAAIVAVSVEELADCATSIMHRGIRQILLEKPAGADLTSIERVLVATKESHSTVWIAYNRRFYSSIIELRKRIQSEGGVGSIHFEFTEWPHVILPKIKNVNVLDNWLFANSSHVIDLAFHLAGRPVKWTPYVSRSLPWHTKAAIYVGAGVTDRGALFSYQANWLSPGRWGLEICTPDSRYILRPLEKLQVQKHKSVAIDFVEIDDSKDIQFKPGLYLQVEAFLKKTSHQDMISIEQHFYQARDILTPMVCPGLKSENG